MFSLLLNIWGWLISKVYPILIFQGLVHLQLYIWGLRNTEEFEANIVSNYQCWKGFISCPANFRNVNQIFLRLCLQKTVFVQNIFVHMGFTLDSIIIIGSCLLVILGPPWRIPLVSFKNHTFIILYNFSVLLSSPEEKYFMPHVHMIALKAANRAAFTSSEALSACSDKLKRQKSLLWYSLQFWNSVDQSYISLNGWEVKYLWPSAQ